MSVCCHRTRKALFFLGLWTIFSLTSVTAKHHLTLDGMWLGATLAELRKEGLVDKTESSLLLFDSIASVKGEDRSSAHFKDGQAQLIVGGELQMGNRTLLAEGQAREKVMSLIKRQGWSVDGSWKSHADVAQHHYQVVRVRVAENEYLLLVFFRSDFAPDEPETVSSIFLRTNDVRAPFGDTQYP